MQSHDDCTLMQLKELEAKLAEMKGKGAGQQSNFYIGPPINMRYTGGSK